MLSEHTIVEDLESSIKEETERNYAATHDGCKDFIEYFNSHEQVTLFSRFDPRTIETQTLKSIVRHINKTLKERSMSC